MFDNRSRLVAAVLVLVPCSCSSNAGRSEGPTEENPACRITNPPAYGIVYDGMIPVPKGTAYIREANTPAKSARSVHPWINAPSLVIREDACSIGDSVTIWVGFGKDRVAKTLRFGDDFVDHRELRHEIEKVKIEASTSNVQCVEVVK